MRPGADCGSDHELLITKFRLKLKKVGKITRPFRYDLNQIPYDYTVEETNRFKGLDLIECLMKYGQRFVTLYRGDLTTYNNNNRKTWNIVRVTKMWHREVMWANAVGKMLPTDLLNTRLPQIFSCKKQYLGSANKQGIIKQSLLVSLLWTLIDVIASWISTDGKRWQNFHYLIQSG